MRQARTLALQCRYPKSATRIVGQALIRRRRRLTGYPYRLARLAEPLPRLAFLPAEAMTHWIAASGNACPTMPLSKLAIRIVGQALIRRRRHLTGYPYRLARLAEPLPRPRLPACRRESRIGLQQAGALALQHGGTSSTSSSGCVDKTELVPPKCRLTKDPRCETAGGTDVSERTASSVE